MAVVGYLQQLIFIGMLNRVAINVAASATPRSLCAAAGRTLKDDFITSFAFAGSTAKSLIAGDFVNG